MKKLLLTLLAVSISIISYSQNVVYLFGMNSQGQPVINTTAIPTVGNTGSYLDLANLPTLNNNITRPINSTTFTVSSTKTALVSYNISISCTASIGGAASGKILLQYFNTTSSTWVDVAEVANSNTVTLALTLNSVQIQTATLTGIIPAGALCKMVPTSSGTTTITYIRGQEYY